MFKYLVALFLIASAAQADSLHPCTPTVQAQDTRISCNQDGVNYRIVVETLMSRPIAACQGKNHVEYKTAKVSVSKFNSDAIAELTIYNGEFSYTLSPDGSSTFKSPALNLDFDKCVSPLHGGISVTN